MIWEKKYLDPVLWNLTVVVVLYEYLQNNFKSTVILSVFLPVLLTMKS